MGEVHVKRKIVKKGADSVILRDYDSCYDTFNYYLFSTEGDVIMQVSNCNCRQIPKVILDKHEAFSVEKHHANERVKFKEWLKKEGYKE